VKRRVPPLLVLALLALVCAALVIVVARFRPHGRSLDDWLARIPPGESIILYVDWDALRRLGVLDLLALSRIGEEPEYAAFVEQTGFDARQDLREVLIAFHPEGNFFLARGRFDWPSLERFVTRQGGTCYNSFCRVEGSRPERRISYFPLRSDVMALAVSRDPSAAYRLQERHSTLPPRPASVAPLWALLPASKLRNAAVLPTGTRLFAKALSETEWLLFAAAPSGDHLELRLEVNCRSAEQARVLLNQLRGLTEALREMIAREKLQPNPRDLSGVLTAGVFEQRDRRVYASWPLGRPFLESLAVGAP
jgi:hypothetical protein